MKITTVQLHAGDRVTLITEDAILVLKIEQVKQRVLEVPPEVEVSTSQKIARR